MLTLVPGDRRADIEQEIFGDALEKGERVLLTDDGEPIGAAVFGIDGDTVVIYRIGIIESKRGMRIGDFFIRALLFKLSQAGLDLRLDFIDDRYEKFGFKNVGGKLCLKAEELVFPSKCKGEGHD